MSKPKKDRTVQYPPSVVYFKPQGIPMFKLEQEVLTVDEYEAIRLVDREGLDQEQAAKKMGVSRATCARVLDSAHKKVAEALTQGKAIRIEGGSFTLTANRYRCLDCGSLWEQRLEQGPAAAAVSESLTFCPQCRSAHVLDFARQIGWRGGGRKRCGKGRGAHGAGGPGPGEGGCPKGGGWNF